MTTEKAKGQLETDAQNLVGDENSEAAVKSNDEKGSDESVVNYATHKKLLNQLKNKATELEELRQFKQQKEEEELAKKGEFTKILSAREERIKELEGKLGAIDRDMTDGTKLQSFLDRLPGKVKKQDYLSFVDLDSIAVDPDTKKVDEVSLERAVKSFVENYPDLIQSTTKGQLPNVGHMGGKPGVAKSLKSLSREELRELYIKGNFTN